MTDSTIISKIWNLASVLRDVSFQARAGEFTGTEKIIKNNLQDINREELNKELIESIKNKKKS